jgi:hypothetical protein
MNRYKKDRVLVLCREKLAFPSALFKRITKLPTVEGRIAAIEGLYRSQGVQPPMGFKQIVKGGDLSGFKRNLRDYKALKTEPLIERGSKVHLNALRDIRAKKFTTLEVGLSKPGAESLGRGLPSTSLEGKILPRSNINIDHKGFRKRQSTARDRIEDSMYGGEGVPDIRGRGPMGEERATKVLELLRHKPSHGLYMAKANTRRSAAYAKRSGGSKGGVIAQVDLPASLVGPSGGKEYIVPRELLRYARNPRMTKLNPSQDPASRKFQSIRGSYLP